MPNKPSKFYAKFDQLRQNIGIPHIPEDTRTMGEKLQQGYINQKLIKYHLPHFEKGGKVKKTGPAIVHKGEVIIPANKVKEYHNNHIKNFWNKVMGGRM